MDIVRISESDICDLLKDCGIEEHTDGGPTGETVTVFGHELPSRYDVSIWDILPKVGLTNLYFQDRCEWAIREAIRSCKADIQREIAGALAEQASGAS